MFVNNQFVEFESIITEFKNKVDHWELENPDLFNELQRIKEAGYFSAKEKGLKNSYDYVLENPIVYNVSLDQFHKNSDIKFIIVADNPGKNEQLHMNSKYLIGQAGKLARNFLIEKNGLINNFDDQVLVLNKTPIHTTKTSDLRKIEFHKELIHLSQEYMASLVYKIHKLLDCELWIIGYSELKRGKIFEPFLNKIIALYKKEKEIKEKVSVFRHFSINSFLNDFNKRFNKGLTVEENLERIGKYLYRKEYLGW